MTRSKESAASEPRTENGAAAAATDPIDQVRELLFGAAKRETHDNLHALEERVEEMRTDFLARLSALESRLIELARDTEKNQAASIDAIGGAIAQLGATIQTMSARRKN